MNDGMMMNDGMNTGYNPDPAPMQAAMDPQVGSALDALQAMLARVLTDMEGMRATLAQVQADVAAMDKRLGRDLADMRGEMNGQRAILVGLGSYIDSIDGHVETLTATLGG